MAASTRETMIDTAWLMIAERGLDGMSVLEVLRRSGAPRGSVQHYFPGGRAELIAAAIDRSRLWMSEQISAITATTPGDVIDGFFEIWARVLTASQFQSGCAAVGVVAGTSTPEQLTAAAVAFDEACTGVASRLESVGIPSKDAETRAALVVSAAEGAVLLARAQQRLDPLSAVGAQLRRDIDHQG